MMRALAAVAALAMTSCITPSDPAEQGERLIAQLKAASGGAKLDTISSFHSAGTRVRNGSIDGTYESWGDVRAKTYAITETFAGITTAGGFDGKSAWSVSPDGKVSVRAASDSRPGDRLNHYLNLNAYYWPERFPAAFLYRGREQADGELFDIVTVTPEGATSFNLWLDPDSHRIARLSGSNGDATFTGVVKAYREVDGISVIAEIAQAIQAGSMTQTETAIVSTYSFEPVPRERFAAPTASDR